MDEQGLRELIIATGKRMLEENLVQGTWGNISVRLGEDKMIITPSGLDYERLTPDKLVIVDINTLEWSGDVKPSGERKVHAAIYRERPDVSAVVHSHPWNGCILAAARSAMPVVGVEEQKILGASVPCAAYGLPSTKKLTEATAEVLKGANACFMANHGICCVGTDLDTAYKTAEVLERACGEFLEERIAAVANGDVASYFKTLVK